MGGLFAAKLPEITGGEKHDFHDPLVNKKRWKDPPLFMGKFTIYYFYGDVPVRDVTIYQRVISVS